MNHRMAISVSFHRNILLLNQLVPPSDDFKKVFREVIVLFYIYNNNNFI